MPDWVVQVGLVWIVMLALFFLLLWIRGSRIEKSKQARKFLFEETRQWAEAHAKGRTMYFNVDWNTWVFINEASGATETVSLGEALTAAGISLK